MGDLFSLKDRVAIVTGSTRGIGFATARLMGRAGAKIVISSRKPAACDEVAARLAGEGIETAAIPCHVGSDSDLRTLVDRTMERFGRIDTVVANAAVNPVFALLHEFTEETWDKIFDVDLKSAWRLARYALPHVAAHGQGGSMTLLSSTASVIAAPRSGAYAVAKAGINHLAVQLASEWGKSGIRINAVAPGVTRTDMIRAGLADDAAMQAAVAGIPLGRIAEPEDIGAVILFLATAGRHITGQTIVVDGGSTLGGG